MVQHVAYNIKNNIKKIYPRYTILEIAYKDILTFQSKQYVGCLLHEPSLVAFAPISLLYLSGRASGQVTRRSLGFWETAHLPVPYANILL